MRSDQKHWLGFIFYFLKKLKLNSSKPKPKSSLSLCLYTSQPPPAISSTTISLWPPLRSITHRLPRLTFGWSQRSQSPLTHHVFLSLRSPPPLSLFGCLDDEDDLVTTTTFYGWRWCRLGLVVLDMMMDFEAWYARWEWWWGWRWCGFSESIATVTIQIWKNWRLFFWVFFYLEYVWWVYGMVCYEKKFVFPKVCIFIVGVVMLEMYLILISVFFFIGVFKLLKVWAL